MSGFAPPPEAVVIRRARLAKGMTVDAAAAKLSEMLGAKFSTSRWSQIETGYRSAGDRRIPQSAPDGRLAQMAMIVGASPDQLREAGRSEAAEILLEKLRQLAELDKQPGESEDEHYVRIFRLWLADRKRGPVLRELLESWERDAG